MEITLNIPEELVAQIIPAGKDPSRAALEAMAIEGYRANRLSEFEVRQLLGLETSLQVHALLKEYGAYLQYSLSDLEVDLQAADKLRAARTEMSASLSK